MCAECGMGFATMSYLPTENRRPSIVGIVIVPPVELKKPGRPGFFLFAGRSDLLDVGGARPLGALLHFVLHLVLLLERLESARLDGGEVHEQILAAVVGGDEAEPLGVVEPLYGTCAHCLP